jgi:hypothetical protein
MLNPPEPVPRPTAYYNNFDPGRFVFVRNAEAGSAYFEPEETVEEISSGKLRRIEFSSPRKYCWEEMIPASYD